MPFNILFTEKSRVTTRNRAHHHDEVRFSTRKTKMTHQPDGNKDDILIELRTDQGEDEVLVDGERLEEGHSDGTETEKEVKKVSLRKRGRLPK